MGHEDFSAEPGKGFGWKSMQDNNQIIDQKLKTQAAASSQSAYFDAHEPVMLGADGTGGGYDAGRLMRTPDRIMRVYFTPYQDREGNLHEGSVVHTVVSFGKWQLRDSLSPSQSPDQSVAQSF